MAFTAEEVISMLYNTYEDNSDDDYISKSASVMSLLAGELFPQCIGLKTLRKISVLYASRWAGPPARESAGKSRGCLCI